MANAYEEAGVNIEAGYEAVETNEKTCCKEQSDLVY